MPCITDGGSFVIAYAILPLTRPKICGISFFVYFPSECSPPVICDSASPCALTGAIVGRQPFGGARASGTNDKAGTVLNMIRWVSAHTAKENFCPSDAIAYPYMVEKNFLFRAIKSSPAALLW